MLDRVAGNGERLESGLGTLVAGDFGTGKSHLLGYLETRALARNFVCSRVVVSKETPLFDMDKMFRAAVENGRVPGVTGQMVEEITQKLDYNSQSYAELLRLGQPGEQRAAPDPAGDAHGPTRRTTTPTS